MNEELLNKIISVAYSDAGLRDRIYIYRMSKKNPEVKAVLDEYKNTAKIVHYLKEEKYPQIARPVKEHSFFFDLYTVLFSNPIRTFAVSLVIVIIAVTSVLLRKPEPQKTFSRYEIEQANAQARKTLAMVGNILNKTKTSVIKEVLPKKVSKPINEGFNYVKDILHKEKKNENIN